MALWTDLSTPVELTELARLSVEERERERFTLAEFLPNETVDDITVRVTSESRGLNEIAEFRAYDAETAIGATKGGKRQLVELPALGQKVRVSEYDRLRSRGTSIVEAGRNILDKATIGVAHATADRMELMRGQVLATGRISLNEGQFIVDEDFGREANLTSQVATKWSEQATASPLADIQKMVDTYVEVNGEQPGSMILSQKAVSALLRTEEVRRMAGVDAAMPTIVTEQFLNETLSAFGLPTITKYDRKVRKGGQNVRVLDEKVTLFLPYVGLPVGKTYWGTTLEASEADYAIAEEDRPGIVVGAYKEDDPMGVWIRAAAIGLPVLHDPNLVSALTVLE